MPTTLSFGQIRWNLSWIWNDIFIRQTALKWTQDLSDISIALLIVPNFFVVCPCLQTFPQSHQLGYLKSAWDTTYSVSNWTAYLCLCHFVCLEIDERNPSGSFGVVLHPHQTLALDCLEEFRENRKLAYFIWFWSSERSIKWSTVLLQRIFESQILPRFQMIGWLMKLVR